jgi:hypothetical protein
VIGAAERLAVALYDRWLADENRLTRALVERRPTVSKVAFGLALGLYPVCCGISWAGIAARRVLGKRPRVVWGPTPILTIAESSALLRRLGYPSTTVVYATYFIRSDFDVSVERAMSNEAVRFWLPNFLFLWSLLRFDVFHVFYDGSFWSGMRYVRGARFLELPLLRLAGKRVVASAYGADVRVRSLNELWQPYNICRECPEPGLHCVCGDHGVERARYYGDWANELLAMGDMHDFVPGSRKDFNYWPIDVAEVPFVGAAPHADRVRVVHSPNHRFFKGTRYIEAAVESLRSQGYDVELDLVERVSNEAARDRYAAADIVFGQCLAGWLGYTEIEAMAAGKPVLGYVRDPGYVAHMDDMPLVSATPDTLEQELAALVSDPPLREELGRRGREFVERNWSYEALAPAYDELHRKVWTDNDLRGALGRKWADLRRGEARVRVAPPAPDGSLREWPVYRDPHVEERLFARGAFGQPPFDAAGLPRVQRDGAYVDHPGVVARYALNEFHLALLGAGADAHRPRFAAAAAWLLERLSVDGEGVGRWWHGYRPAGREVELPWIAASTQGLGASVLLRAEQELGGGDYRRGAAAAVAALRLPVADGGALYERWGRTFLEEFPEPEPAHVLPGLLNALVGLHEYHRVTREPWAAELLRRCLDTLVRDLRWYEHPAGIRVDYAGDRRLGLDEAYLVVQQLRALHALTGRPELGRTARRWGRRVQVARLREFVRLRRPL